MCSKTIVITKIKHIYRFYSTCYQIVNPIFPEDSISYFMLFLKQTKTEINLYMFSLENKMVKFHHIAEISFPIIQL